MRGQQCKICNKESKNDFDEYERCGCSQNTMGNSEISTSKSGLLCNPEGTSILSNRGPERSRVNSTTTTDTQVSHTSIVHWWIRACHDY